VGLRALIRGLGVGGRKRKNAGVKAKKRVLEVGGRKVKDPPIAVGESLVSLDLWILGRWLQIHYF